jgi:23S rRNA pseudouridine2605 synthase
MKKGERSDKKTINSGQKRTSSGQRRSASSQGPAGTREKRSTSGQRSSSSGQRRSASGQESAGTGERRTTSGQRSATPTQRRSASGQESPGTRERRTTSGQRSAPPTQRRSASGQESAGTGERRTTSGQRSATPTQRRSASGQKSAGTRERRTTSGHRPTGSEPGFTKRPRINTTTPRQNDDNSVRLNKFIATSGICSRREADEYIKAGLITVNGNIVTELGTKVAMKDDVRYHGERIKKEKLVYILINKPKDFITTVKDPHATRTVLQLVASACKERIYPVGRLDRNTTGVLLLTNDGDLAKTLTHPRYNKMKIYHVTLDKSVTGADLKQIREGVTLEDGFIKADDISYIDPVDKTQVGIEIHSGKNRIVRRIFEQLGYRIKKLDRVYFAGLTKKGLTRGQWRHLTEIEVGMLKMGSYK